MTSLTPAPPRRVPLVALVTFILAASAAASAQDLTIPSVDGTTLAGEHVRLPQDLAAASPPRSSPPRSSPPRSSPPRSAILVLGFSKAARTPVRDWGKRLADEFSSSSTVLFYEMPVVAAVPRLFRGAVLHSIAEEVSDRGKHHFLPITADEARWRSLAGYGAPDNAYLLVVNAAGTVVWHTDAALSPASLADLRRHLPSP